MKPKNKIEVEVGTGHCDIGAHAGYLDDGIIIVSTDTLDLAYALCFECYDRIHDMVLKARAKRSPNKVKPANCQYHRNGYCDKQGRCKSKIALKGGGSACEVTL